MGALGIVLRKEDLENVLRKMKKHNASEVVYEFNEGFRSFFMEYLAEFYSLPILFSKAREKALERLKNSTVKIKGARVKPIVFMLPLALLESDIKIVEEGGFEFMKRIESLLSEKGINIDGILDNEKSKEIMKALISFVDEEKIMVDEIIWYFLLVYAKSGLLALKVLSKVSSDKIEIESDSK